jgi:2TM domain
MTERQDSGADVGQATGRPEGGLLPSAERSSEREQARKRVEKKRKVWGDIAAYVVINASLIAAWAATGAGYFWPGWVLAGWGMLLMLDVWNVFFRRPITDADVDAEMRQSR